MTNEQQKEIVAELRDLRQDIVMMMDTQKMANEKFDYHAQTDSKFQTKAEPIIDWILNLINSGKMVDKILKWVFWFIVTVLGIIFGIRKL